MPRRKPTKNLDVCGKLEKKPEAAVGDFLESKVQDGFFFKPPNWDSAGNTSELMYLDNVREHDNMVRLQKEMIENSKRQEAANTYRTERLYKTEAYLRKRFIDVNAFIKDCIEKKQQTQRTLDKESANHKILRERIEKHKESISVLTEFRKDLEATTKEYELYERVTEEVVEKSDLFESVKDCMDRCDALMLAQVDIFNLNEQKIQEIENIRSAMTKMIHEVALAMLGLKNELNELERSYNKARDGCIKWERILTVAKDKVNMNDQDKNRSLDVLQMMYRIFCRRNCIEPTLQRREVEKELDFIKDEMELLNEVVLEFEGTQPNKFGSTSRQKKC